MTTQVAEQLFTSPSDQGNSTFERSGARIGRRCWGRWLSVLIVALAFSPLAFAAPPDGKGKGGGGGGGGEEPPSTPVTYQLTWLDGPNGNDVPASFPTNLERRIIPKGMNNLGIVVGLVDEGYPWENKRAFRYDFASKTLDDVNDLAQIWVDLDVDPDDVENRTPAGWIAIEAYEVNDHGEIVGAAQHSETAEQRAFVYLDGVRQFLLLPRVGDGDSYGSDINNDGVIVAEADESLVVYSPWTDPPYTAAPLGVDPARVHINNLGGIVTGRGIHISPDPDYDYTDPLITPYLNTEFRDINDNGLMVGIRLSVGKGKNRTPGGPILIDPMADIPEQFVGDGAYAANGINYLGDVVSGPGPALLWLQGFSDVEENGPLLLQDLVVDEDFYGGTPWCINDFGQICGYQAPRAYILTPNPSEN